jgi:hypothetical protein|tara:strand:- start:704 stop:1138 length:435 start_codon:yes stop_codon:yes gene_type:complete
MNLDDYYNAWAEDSKIDRTELGEESIRIPQLHHKYYRFYSAERMKLVKLQEEYKVLKKDKHDYLSGIMAEEDLNERGWEPNPLRILKTDIPMYIESDKDIVNHNLKIAYAKEKVEFLESIVKSLNVRGYQIKTAVDWEKFKVGL